MAPEQAAGSTSEIGPAADVYALGAILYELLDRPAAVQGRDAPGDARAGPRARPGPAAVAAARNVRATWKRFASSAWRRSPQRRYESAADLAADLRAFLHEEPISAQSLTILDQVARSIGHHTFDSRFRGLANRMAFAAPIPARGPPGRVCSFLGSTLLSRRDGRDDRGHDLHPHADPVPDWRAEHRPDTGLAAAAFHHRLARASGGDGRDSARGRPSTCRRTGPRASCWSMRSGRSPPRSASWPTPPKRACIT